MSKWFVHQAACQLAVILRLAQNQVARDGNNLILRFAQNDRMAWLSWQSAPNLWTDR